MKLHYKMSTKPRDGRTYCVWQYLKCRCIRPSSPSYRTYGALGVTLHHEWVYHYDAFQDYMGVVPGRDYDICRIDLTKPYEPGNVCWARSNLVKKRERMHRKGLAPPPLFNPKPKRTKT